tara:strand:- start:1287 stop:1649 length:363 start_codon:yes stop_codon:yes gene_type:complete
MTTKIILTALISLFLTSQLQAEPYWAQKPVQCGPTQEVMDRIDQDGLKPLMMMTGNARVENIKKVLPYAFYYEVDEQFWIMVEFFSAETVCVVGVGQGVNFDVSVDEVEETQKEEFTPYK